MPFEMTTFTLPCGERAVRIEYWGTISKEDATEVLRRLDTGGSHHGMSTLTVTVKEHTVSPEARRLFNAFTFPAVPAGALVNSNMLTRVFANFIVRANKSSDRMRSFSSEADAIPWMDERTRAVRAAERKP
jgi:hypothetical protein